MDQTRTDIWDYVFKSGPQTIGQIATQLAIDPSEVMSIVNHDWFTLQGDTVTIATNDAAAQ